MNISRGSYLCSEGGVEIDTRWGGFQNLFGGEGGFLIHASGSGEVVASCYGALDSVTLGAGRAARASTPATWSPSRTASR